MNIFQRNLILACLLFAVIVSAKLDSFKEYHGSRSDLREQNFADTTTQQIHAGDNSVSLGSHRVVESHRQMIDLSNITDVMDSISNFTNSISNVTNIVNDDTDCYGFDCEAVWIGSTVAVAVAIVIMICCCIIMKVAKMIIFTGIAVLIVVTVGMVVAGMLS